MVKTLILGPIVNGKFWQLDETDIHLRKIHKSFI